METWILYAKSHSGWSFFESSSGQPSLTPRPALCFPSDFSQPDLLHVLGLCLKSQGCVEGARGWGEIFLGGRRRNWHNKIQALWVWILNLTENFIELQIKTEIRPTFNLFMGNLIQKLYSSSIPNIPVLPVLWQTMRLLSKRNASSSSMFVLPVILDKKPEWGNGSEVLYLLILKLISCSHVLSRLCILYRLTWLIHFWTEAVYYSKKCIFQCVSGNMHLLSFFEFIFKGRI